MSKRVGTPVSQEGEGGRGGGKGRWGPTPLCEVCVRRIHCPFCLMALHFASSRTHSPLHLAQGLNYRRTPCDTCLASNSGVKAGPAGDTTSILVSQADPVSECSLTMLFFGSLVLKNLVPGRWHPVMIFVIW